MSEPNTLPATKRPTNPLRQVITWIIAGHDEATIREAIETSYPDEKIQPLIVKAVKEIAKQAGADADVVRGFAIEGTRQIYQRSLEAGDHPTALRALKQLVELSR